MRIVDIRETAVPLKSTLAQFELRLLRDDHVGGRGDHRRDARRQAGRRLRVQLHRPLRLRRADARRASSRASCKAPAGNAARRERRQSRSGEDPRLHDAAREGRRPHRALDRASAPSRSRCGTRSPRSPASRCIACWPSATTAARSPTRCSATSAAAGTRRARPFADLQDEMRRHLDAGYTMVKMKVGGLPLAEDVQRVEAVKSILPPRAELAVDANCKFDRDEALAYAKALAPFGLRWFEEPCDPLDYALLAEIAARLRRRRSSTGENLFSTQDVENLVRFGGLQAGPRRRDPDRSAAGLRHRAVRAHARRCWSATAGRAARCFRTAATRCRSPSPAASGSAARNPIPACSARSRGFADDAQGGERLSRRSPTGPASASRAQTALYAIMRELAA